MSLRGGVHKFASQERSSGLHTYGGNHRGPYQEKNPVDYTTITPHGFPTITASPPPKKKEKP